MVAEPEKSGPERVSLRAGRRSRRTRIGLLVALGTAVTVVALVHVLLNMRAVTSAVRERVLERLSARVGACRLGDAVSISWTGEVTLGPLEIEGPLGVGPAVVIDRLRVRVSAANLIRGRVVPTHVTLVGMKVDTDRHLDRLRELIHLAMGKKAASAGAEGKASPQRTPSIELVDARLQLEDPSGGSPYLVGPVSITLAEEGAEAARRWRAHVGFPSKGRLEVTAQLPLEGSAGHPAQPGHFSAEADAVPLTMLGGFLPGSLVIQAGMGSGVLKVELEAGMGRATAALQLGARGLVVSSERLADVPVGPWDASYTGQLTWDRSAATLSLSDSRVQLGAQGVELPFEAQVALGSEITFDADARMGPLNLQALVGSLPEQLRPGADAPHIDGPLRSEVHLSGPLRRLDDWAVDLKLDTSGLKAVARDAPFPLREGFAYRPETPDKTPRVVWVGERNPDFVPITELPPIVPAAVTTSEDASFYAHNGFDLDEIRDSLANAAEGARLRGGSTLTQQLAKNLYLNRERTLARKLKEALITLQLEAALPKARILEIYLNLIEWGPDIYGVGPAARYYFGIDARNLDAKQAVFLASIIPNPSKFGPYYRHHGLSDNWQRHLTMEIERLQERGFLTAEQSRRALQEPLGFRETDNTSRSAHPDRARH